MVAISYPITMLSYNNMNIVYIGSGIYGIIEYITHSVYSGISELSEINKREEVSNYE
jgi:hypothetical protein